MCEIVKKKKKTIHVRNRLKAEIYRQIKKAG